MSAIGMLPGEIDPCMKAQFGPRQDIPHLAIIARRETKSPIVDMRFVIGRPSHIVWVIPC